MLRQSLELIAKFPAIVAFAYIAMRHKFYGEPLFIDSLQKKFDIASSFLYMLRPEGKFSSLEAQLLDLALILHAEHGGGNNSSFTMHVVTSSHADTYSSFSAALDSLKGPLHGAANENVMDMRRNIKDNLRDWTDQEEVAAYIEKILMKQAPNPTGLVYGMGYAAYAKSDPRAVNLKQKAKELVISKNRLDEYDLYQTIEEMTPQIFERVKKSDKPIAANVDLHSGFVYDMLAFPQEIYTPLFAMGRMAGWAANRIDELINGGRIVRPAYKNVGEVQDYISMEQRGENSKFKN